MFSRVVAAALAVIAILATTPAPAAPGPEAVEISHGENILKAELYRPEGDGPFPAVVALHGCEGMRGSNGLIAPFYRDWAERLNKAGFAVLYPDSYGSRDLNVPCRNRALILRTNRERIGDAAAAREWLQSQPFIKPDRISLLGWSSGGVTVLWAVRPSARAPRRQAGFSLGRRALSGLYAARNHGVECTHPNADPCRRCRRLVVRQSLRADGRGRARSQCACEHRRLPGRVS